MRRLLVAVAVASVILGLFAAYGLRGGGSEASLFTKMVLFTNKSGSFVEVSLRRPVYIYAICFGSRTVADWYFHPVVLPFMVSDILRYFNNCTYVKRATSHIVVKVPQEFFKTRQWIPVVGGKAGGKVPLRKLGKVVPAGGDYDVTAKVKLDYWGCTSRCVDKDDVEATIATVLLTSTTPGDLSRRLIDALGNLVHEKCKGAGAGCTVKVWIEAEYRRPLARVVGNVSFTYYEVRRTKGSLVIDNNGVVLVHGLSASTGHYLVNDDPVVDKALVSVLYKPTPQCDITDYTRMLKNRLYWGIPFPDDGRYRTITVYA